ncbi:MAG: hypothetical protein HZA13_01895 [Nitrospirae bacterium]|nr:hypothetical protein [Nitrospirota bacterium]
MKLRALIMFIMMGTLFSSCLGVYNRVIIEDNKIRYKGLYEVNALDGEWKWHEVNQGGRSLNSFYKYDGVYFRCSNQQEQMITIEQESYNWPPGKKPRRILGQEGSPFETIVMDFLDEHYDAMKPKIPKRELISFQEIHLADYKAVEAMFVTELSYPGSCDSKEKSIRSLKFKYVVIKRGEWKESYAWFGFPLSSLPNLIVLWYRSPVEAFDTGVDEFDRMVQSFRFIKEQPFLPLRKKIKEIRL